MSTHTIAETVKDVIQKSKVDTRATFIANRKEVLIKEWWDEFNEENGKTFEEIYTGWEIDAFFGILSQPYKIPSIVVCSDALNDKGCDWDRFNEFFQGNLKLK